MHRMILAAVAVAAGMPAAAQAGEAPRHMRAGTSLQTPINHAPMRHDDPPGAFNDYPGYRMVPRGSMLPRDWHAPRYGISDHGTYGFDRPPAGSRWVRYYDDALLVDRYGRVQDGRYGMDFDRYGDGWDYDDRGIPAHPGDLDDDPKDRDYAYRERMERHGGDLDYDRDYPYEHPYGGRGQNGQAYGYGGGYTITETTVTTGPSVVTYLDQEKVAVHRPKRYLKTRRAHRAKSAMRCAC